ncbi:MAG: hypothetical protein F6K55_43735 [Moorea sp. SIO4A3]|nr:hypothetical protein [Moorena sp. SIO4A3]
MRYTIFCPSCLLPIAYYLLPLASCLLPLACSLLPTPYSLKKMLDCYKSTIYW